MLLPYLVLLRVGFSLPPSLLTERCALTAPFHPYPAQLRPEIQPVGADAPFYRRFLAVGRDCFSGSSWAGRYIFCGTFRKRPLKAAPRTLSGTPLCGVRTFLSQPAQPDLTAEAASPKRN